MTNEIEQAERDAMRVLSDWVDALQPKFNGVEMQALKQRLTAAFREKGVELQEVKSALAVAEFERMMQHRAESISSQVNLMGKRHNVVSHDGCQAELERVEKECDELRAEMEEWKQHAARPQSEMGKAADAHQRKAMRDDADLLLKDYCHMDFEAGARWAFERAARTAELSSMVEDIPRRIRALAEEK